MADVELLFGVQGGTSIEKGSGKLIAAEISAITSQIQEKTTKHLEFAVDPKSLEKVKADVEEALKDVKLSIGSIGEIAGKASEAAKGNAPAYSPKRTLIDLDKAKSIVADIEKKSQGLVGKMDASKALQQITDIKSQIDSIEKSKANGAKANALIAPLEKLGETIKTTQSDIDNAINSQNQNVNNRYDKLLKTNKELYKLKKKQLTAGEKESAELQKQVVALEKKRDNQRKYLRRNDLKSPDREEEIGAVKESFENERKLILARTQDTEIVKSQSKAAAEAARASSDAAKQQSQNEKELVAAINERSKLQKTLDKTTDSTTQQALQQEIDIQTDIINSKKSELSLDEAENAELKDKIENLQKIKAAEEATSRADYSAKETSKKTVVADKEGLRALSAYESELKKSNSIYKKLTSESDQSVAEALKIQYDKQVQIVEEAKKQLDVYAQTNSELDEQANTLKEVYELERKTADAAKEAKVAASNTIDESEYAKYDKRVEALVGSGAKIQNSSVGDIYKDTEVLKDYYASIKQINEAWAGFDRKEKKLAPSTNESDIKSIEEFISKLNSAEESAKRFNSTLSTRNSFTNNITQNNKLLSEALAYYQKYSDEISRNSDLNKKWQSIINRLTLGEFTNDISKGRQELSYLKAATQGAGIEVENLTKKFRNLFGQHLDTAFVMAGIHLLKQGLREVYESVKEVNTAMTELRKVTDESEASYKSFMKTAEATSVRIGATLSDTISSTADFARLGYTLDESAQLSEAALVYKNVGDGIEDINAASESIISTLKAFGIEAKDAMAIVDKFNITGNNFSISSKGVGDALQRSAAALAAAGNSLEESIALITAANSVVQDAEVVGKRYADVKSSYNG